MKWQPIVTAPRDGSWVLLWSESTSWVNDLNTILGFYDQDTGAWYECESDGRPIFSPTHWSPLPSKPQ